ncbi:hypothetical protein B0H14DRAFT_2620218 [Mycena olivaceomarginata]|nr:hypothetical protein B0H14DRAFT_2620218 [Mycena olivaceomarginata]
MSNSNKSVDSNPHQPKSKRDKQARNAQAAATYRAKRRAEIRRSEDMVREAAAKRRDGDADYKDMQESGKKHLPGICPEGRKWCRSREGITTLAASKKSIRHAEKEANIWEFTNDAGHDKHPNRHWYIVEGMDLLPSRTRRSGRTSSIEQRQLADQILARDLRAIHEEAERCQEYHAAGDANFDRLQDEVSSPSAPASPHPTGRRKRHRPARGRRQAAGREIVPKDEIVPDSEEELAVPDSSDDNTEQVREATGRKSPAPRAKTEKGPTRVKPRMAGAARESHPPRVKTQVGPDRVKREAGTGPVQVKHEAGASPVRIKRKAGAAPRGGHRPVQVKHEVGTGPVCIKHEAGAAFDSDALPKSTPVHAVVPPRRSARVGRDSLPALSDEDLAYPQSSRPSPPRSGKPAPLFDSDEEPRQPAPCLQNHLCELQAVYSPNPCLPSPPPQLAVSATPPAAYDSTGSHFPQSQTYGKHRSPLQVVVISDSSGEASPISRSLGKRQKVVMPTGPLMESASAAPGASSAPPKIFVNQADSGDLQKLVALEAMGEDECVVPMDPEEAGADDFGARWVLVVESGDFWGGFLPKISEQNVVPQTEPLKKICELVNATGAAPGDSGNGAAVASSGGAAAAPGGSVASAPDGSAATGSKAPPRWQQWRGRCGCCSWCCFWWRWGWYCSGWSWGWRCSRRPWGWCCSTPVGAGAVPGSAAAAGSGGEVPLADAIEPDDGDSNWVDEDTLAGLASTHRSRNPLAPLIRARSKAKRVRGPNMKATEHKRRESKIQKGRAHCGGSPEMMQELNEDLPAGSNIERQLYKYMAEEIEDKREELERKKLAAVGGRSCKLKSCCTRRQVGAGELDMRDGGRYHQLGRAAEELWGHDSQWTSDDYREAKHCYELQNYIKVLVQGRGVGLLVWPQGGEFKRMGKQSSLGPLRILYDHLKDGRTKWVKLSRRQEEKIVEEFEEMVREGKRKEKIRGRRSDLGGTHQVRNPRNESTAAGKDNDVDIHEDDNSDDNDDEDPATSRKHTSSSRPRNLSHTKPTKSTSTKKPTAPKKSLLHLPRVPGLVESEVLETSLTSHQQRNNGLARTTRGKKNASLTLRTRGKERPRKKKKPAELKRLEKQMEKGREKAEENRARPKPRPIVKGKRGGPPGVRE